MRCTITAMAMLAAAATPAAAQWTSARPDGHAPIGVMGDHTHEQGEFMGSYRFMRMEMDGMRDGTSEVSTADVLDPAGYDFVVTPTGMTTTMQTFGGMYAISDGITLMGMIPVISRNMDHATRPGDGFKVQSGGLGDISVGALISLARWGNQRLHANAIASLPTGGIEEMDVTPASAPAEAQLPYPMQNGAGVVGLKPGLTWLGQAGTWSWGAQGQAAIYLGENDRDWAPGTRFMGTAWGAHMFTRWLSASVRMAAESWGGVEGADAALNPMMVPTADPDLLGGTRLLGGLGVNLEARGGALAGGRVAVELLLPLMQDLDGPQLQSDMMLVAGAQYVFF